MTWSFVAIVFVSLIVGAVAGGLTVFFWLILQFADSMDRAFGWGGRRRRR